MGRIEILAEFLAIELEEGETLEDYIEETDDNEFEAEGKTFLVLTDEEADEKAKEHIRNDLWAFNPEFLSGYTGLPVEVFSALQEQHYEDCNETIFELVDKFGGLDKLADEAIGYDGRGHFMSSYDGQEHELGEYFIYRTN